MAVADVAEDNEVDDQTVNDPVNCFEVGVYILLLCQQDDQVPEYAVDDPHPNVLLPLFVKFQAESL